MKRALPFSLALLVAALTATGAAATPPDRPARTPVAKEGSEAARKGSISRRALRRRLSDALRSAGANSGAFVWDIDANRRRRLFADDPGGRQIPASNQKLFTTAALLHRFGPRARLKTRVYDRGRRRGGRNRILRGKLVLVGAGDPALGSPRFARRRGVPLTPLAELARDVDEAGIRRVTRGIRADDNVFDRRRGVDATGGTAGPYLSPLSGLSYNSGYSGGGYARHPELVAARKLRRLLRNRGVKVEGGIGRADLRRKVLSSRPLGRVRSPTIGSLISETNKPSNNFFAEMLLKRLAAQPGKRGTTDRGANRVEGFARNVGSGVRADDGSGLGRANRVTPRNVVRLLVAMAKDPRDRRAFRLSLPVAGREGTVADRMRGTAAQDRCRTKTGTLSGVSALSGYCRAGPGRVAFSILMNSVGDLTAARRAQDRMAALIARYRR